MPRFEHTFGSPPADSYTPARRRSSRSGFAAHRTMSAATLNDDADGIGGPMACVFNLVNNIVGAGLLSMAWCLKEATAVPGLAALAMMCIFNIYSFVLLAKCCEYAGTFSYKEMGHQALGKKWGYFIQFTMALYTTGSCISYVVLTGDFLSGHTGVVSYWLPNSVLTNRQLLVAIMTVLVILPLSSFQQLDKLKFTSVASFFGILMSLAVVIYEWNEREDRGLNHGHDVVIAAPRLGLFTAIPILNVAFCAAYNAPRYYQELRERSVKKFAWVVITALTFCFLVYASMAITGYLTFGKNTNSDLLTNYGTDITIVLITRFVLTFVVIFTYPLSFHSLRLSTFTLLSLTSIPKETLKSRGFYICVAGSLIALTVVPGAVVNNVGIVLDYKGAIFGSSIIFIWPGLMYIQLKRQVEGFAMSEVTQPLLGRGTPSHVSNASATIATAATSKDSRAATGSSNGVRSAASGQKYETVVDGDSSTTSDADRATTGKPGNGLSAGVSGSNVRGLPIAGDSQMTVNFAGGASIKATPVTSPVGSLRSAASSAFDVDVDDALPLSSLYQWSHVPPCLLIMFGVVFMVMGVAITTLKLVGVVAKD